MNSAHRERAELLAAGEATVTNAAHLRAALTELTTTRQALTNATHQAADRNPPQQTSVMRTGRAGPATPSG